MWRWPIPAYLFSGGLAAGCALVSAGAHVAGDRRLDRRTSLAAVGAAVASTGFLIHDLGRPARFHHMLRVLKPTSPMSVGTWIFSAFSGAAGATLAVEVGAPRWRRLAGVGHGASAALAPLLATYTAVLVADTAVPVWHGARHELPFLFAAGAAASGGAAGVLLADSPAAAAGPRRLALAAAALEMAADARMRQRLGPLASPYRAGVAGALHRSSRRATLTGAALLAGAGRRRWLAAAGAVAIGAGAAAERFAIFHAGRASAADPAHVVEPQRRGLVARAPDA